MSTGVILWLISLGISLIVIGVVALLLHLVKSTAIKIDYIASEIWTHGKLTANNTIHIPLFFNKNKHCSIKYIFNCSKHC